VKTVLFSFPNDKVRDQFLRLTKAAADTMLLPETIERDATARSDGECLKNALGTVRLDPAIKADHERVVALFVSGQKMQEGSLAELRKRFQQECDSHKANVELRELREGEWVTIHSRRLQRPTSPL
jgi:hypothetical protein